MKKIPIRKQNEICLTVLFNTQLYVGLFMKNILRQAWNDDAGFLTFEWTLLSVLLVLGIVAGLTATRDAFIDELSDTAEAILNFDQTYSFAGIPLLGIPASNYNDDLGTVTDCNRGGPAGQNGGVSGDDLDS
jgi:Flp pilus assembly pilin Flp